MQNPYEPPKAERESKKGQFVPLESRTRTTAIAFAIAVSMSLAMEAALVADGGRLSSGAMHPADFVYLFALPGLGVAMVVGAALHGAWIVGANRNLRALGRTGLRFSPLLAVVSFYVPVANWVLPVLVVHELWRASNPDAQAAGRGWRNASSKWWLVALWWAVWIASGVETWTSLLGWDPSAPHALEIAGALASGLMGLAAFAGFQIMKEVTVRQDKAARLSPAPLTC